MFRILYEEAVFVQAHFCIICILCGGCVPWFWNSFVSRIAFVNHFRTIILELLKSICWWFDQHVCQCSIPWCIAWHFFCVLLYLCWRLFLFYQCDSASNPSSLIWSTTVRCSGDGLRLCFINACALRLYSNRFKGSVRPLMFGNGSVA